MRFRVRREALAGAVAWAARALPEPERAGDPAPARLKIDAANGRVRLSGASQWVGARSEIRADTSEHGMALVCGARLAVAAEALAADPAQGERDGDDLVEVVLDGPRLELGVGECRLSLLAARDADFPELPPTPAAAGTLPAEVLASALNQVIAAASRDESAPVLTGVRIEARDDLVTLAALDRYRCAVRSVRWRPERADLVATVLAPARPLAAFVAAFPADAQVSVALGAAGGAGGPRLLGVRAGGRRATLRLLDGEVPRYDSLFPAEFASVAAVPREPLISAIGRITSVAGRGAPVRLRVGDGSIRLEAGSPDAGMGCERVEAKLSGPALDIAFSSTLLLDGLAALRAPVVELALTTATGKAVLRGRADLDADADADFRYLLMPVRMTA